MAEKKRSSIFCRLSFVTACCLMNFSVCDSGSDSGISMVRKNAMNLSSIICRSLPFSRTSTYVCVTYAQTKQGRILTAENKLIETLSSRCKAKWLLRHVPPPDNYRQISQKRNCIRRAMCRM